MHKYINNGTEKTKTVIAAIFIQYDVSIYKIKNFYKSEWCDWRQNSCCWALTMQRRCVLTIQKACPDKCRRRTLTMQQARPDNSEGGSWQNRRRAPTIQKASPDNAEGGPWQMYKASPDYAAGKTRQYRKRAPTIQKAATDRARRASISISIDYRRRGLAGDCLVIVVGCLAFCTSCHTIMSSR